MAIDTTLEQIESLYIGYFGRAGEANGTNYWINQLQSGYTLAEAAASFSVQPEAINEYPYLAHPDLVNPGSFVDQVYQNLFNRAPDAEGRAYWVDQLQAREGDPAAIGQFILDVISGAYGPEGSPADQATLENKVEAASYFTAELAEAGIGGTHIVNGFEVLNENLVGPSHSAVSSVTADDATVQASENATDAFIAGGGAAVGATFTLTAGTDFADAAGSVRNDGHIPSDFKFTSSSEAVIATGATLNVTGANGPDSLSDPSTTDNDILNLSLSTVAPGAATISNIETINVDFANYNGASGLDLTNVSGARTIDLDGSLTAHLDLGTGLATSGITTVDGSGLTSTVNGFTANFSTASGTVARTLVGSEANDVLIGGNGNDNIQGRGGNDVIDGRTGNDTLDGGEGDDTVFGGTGNDTINGGDGNDFLFGQDGNDIINGGAGNDTINGDDGNDTLDGGAGDDTIGGGAGDDVILGGDGADTIFTGTGDNTVTGGAGDDTITLDVDTDTVLFSATALGNGADTINNFLAGDTGDIINFSSFLGGASVLSTSVATAAGFNATDFNVVRVNDVTIHDAASLQADIGDGADELNLAVSSNTVALVQDGANVEAYYVTTDALGNATTVDLVGTFNGTDVGLLTEYNIA